MRPEQSIPAENTLVSTALSLFCRKTAMAFSAVLLPMSTRSTTPDRACTRAALVRPRTTIRLVRSPRASSICRPLGLLEWKIRSVPRAPLSSMKSVLDEMPQVLTVASTCGTRPTRWSGCGGGRDDSSSPPTLSEGSSGGITRSVTSLALPAAGSSTAARLKKSQPIMPAGALLPCAESTTSMASWISRKSGLAITTGPIWSVAQRRIWLWCEPPTDVMLSLPKVSMRSLSAVAFDTTRPEHPVSSSHSPQSQPLSSARTRMCPPGVRRACTSGDMFSMYVVSAARACTSGATKRASLTAAAPARVAT
mmetsp:Transcript_12566/g.52867  ORF Transcript_12566/g.52867 Transcript_12566/m.52867 type:complete len:308 (+) Transcript_12566:115-1038(+)